jgi:YidC/Oxa1 family membrane protein insertase
LCRPTDEETIKLYLENGVDLSKLPYCVCDSEYVTDDSKYKLPEKEETVETTEETKTEETKKEEKKEDGKVATPSNEQEEVKEEEKTKCKSFKVTTGGYEGLWTSIFVKPLAWLILFFGKYLSNFGLGLIAVTIVIRLVMYPLTRKTAMQSENMKAMQPDLDRINKKYEGKTDQESMQKKSMETMQLYKKYGVNPFSSCLFAFIQIPLLMAFYEAINRVPVIFEGKLFGLILGSTPLKAISGGHFEYIIIVILIVGTTIIQQKLNKTAPTPQNGDINPNMMNNMMIIMIAIMSINFSIALSLYWIASTCFTIVQNLIVKKIKKKN